MEEADLFLNQIRIEVGPKQPGALFGGDAHGKEAVRVAQRQIADELGAAYGLREPGLSGRCGQQAFVPGAGDDRAACIDKVKAEEDALIGVLQGMQPGAQMAGIRQLLNGRRACLLPQIGDLLFEKAVQALDRVHRFFSQERVGFFPVRRIVKT